MTSGSERSSRSHFQQIKEQHSFISFVLVCQGVFYLLTGLWPLVSATTFEKVTGPKTDFWLVKTVGVLVAVVGGILTMAGLRRKPSPETALLAVGSAASLAAVDMVYVSKNRISAVYLVDAIAELVLILAWIVGLQVDKRR